MQAIGSDREWQMQLGSLARPPLTSRCAAQEVPRTSTSPQPGGWGDPSHRNSSDKGAGPKWGLREGCSEAVMWKLSLERWVGENQAKSVEKSTPSSGASLCKGPEAEA